MTKIQHGTNDAQDNLPHSSDSAPVLPAGAVKEHRHVAQNATAPNADDSAPLPAETGGQAGPEPTRYGDWEKKGRCTDF